MVMKYLKLDWKISEIRDIDTLRFILNDIKCNKYDFFTLDTETSGLHIILDKPFCITFSLVDMKNKKGYAYIINIKGRSDNVMALLQAIIQNMDTLLCWNTKFDTHMCANVGLDLFKARTLSDVMIYARLATDAVPTDKGGPPMSLKDFCKKFITPDADYYERKIANLKKNVLLNRNEKLKEIGVSISVINEILKDKVNSVDDLPEDVKKIMKDPKYNPNNYENLPWDELKQYAAYDSVLAAEAYMYCLPIVKEREQLKIAEMETKLIPILWRMERVGFELNKFYLLQTKSKVKNYLLQRRKEMCQLVGKEFKVGQHALIKDIFKSYGVSLESSDQKALSALVNEKGKVGELARTILELRTLEKWYSTYICKWLEQSENHDRIYTSFNQVGAVSGRFSSDFQQFPKDTIYKNNGEELFVPRRIVKVSGNGYDKLCFIDFSAEELRIQAAYTILVGEPDLNLCRAFLPYKCDPTTWEPTDLHSLTTLTAFPELTVDHPEFKHYRYIGKRANFCINYGGTQQALKESLGVSQEIANKLYTAYKKAYPGVQAYKNYVSAILSNQNYITNLFGRRYYNASAHNCCNYLIQGSGADLLKTKLIELDNYLKPLKSRIVCTIHDEIVFEIYRGEESVIPDLKRIMETFKELPIPLKSEVEVTTSTWDAKKEYIL